MAPATAENTAEHADSNPSSSAGGPPMPLKQKMAVGLRSLIGGARKLVIDDGSAGRGGPARLNELFPKVDPAVDGEDCLRDCDSCTIKYPKNFKVNEDDALYGFIKAWSTHLLVATGKSDWVRDVTDEKGSVMQAIGHAKSPSNGRLMLSASNIPTPHHTSDYSEPTTVLLLPAFVVVENVTPATVPTLLGEIVEKAPTTSSPPTPLFSWLPRPVTTPLPEGTPPALCELRVRPCPHAALVLLCSQRTRDARCGQSAPLLRRELERHLRPLGLHRDFGDERPGGVGVYFISHVGGHKYSANVLVYRRPDAFGLDGVARGKEGDEAQLVPRKKEAPKEDEDVGAAQCIWLARVRPEDCEGLVKYTILQGKVIKPEKQLRGGFDRARGVFSW